MIVERGRARTLLLVTFLVFFLPIMGAWLLNVFAPDWRPFGTVNHGTLVQPVRPVSASGLEDGHGRKIDAGYLSGRWTVVHVLGGPCGKNCLEALARTRQVHQALGDDMNRVQRLLVAGNPANAPGIDPPPEFAFAVADSAWLSAFSFSEAGADPVPGIYLVDPQGYLMMRYPADVDQRGLLADLERLLKISKIG
jgi:cytochrome oxidase Cu insertion factor (SCO1/SenC/PrrC family)